MDMTNEQARLLRKVRQSLKGVSIRADEAAAEVGEACSHLHTNYNCPVCRLAVTIGRAARMLEKFDNDLDAELLRGPVPRGAKEQLL